MSQGNERTVFFDLETGGIYPKRHPIIQIAAVAVNTRLEPVEIFEMKIAFEKREANRNSLRKNNYHPGLWKREAVEPCEAARAFAAFLWRHATVPTVAANGSEYHVAQLVAHNAAFDGPFLQAWYDKQGVYLPARRQVFCTMQRAMWYFHETPAEAPPKNFKLATLCQYFNVPFHAASAHDALGDVTATLKLYGAIRSACSLQAAVAA